MAYLLKLQKRRRYSFDSIRQIDATIIEHRNNET